MTHSTTPISRLSGFVPALAVLAMLAASAALAAQGDIAPPDKTPPKPPALTGKAKSDPVVAQPTRGTGDADPGGAKAPDASATHPGEHP